MSNANSGEEVSLVLKNYSIELHAFDGYLQSESPEQPDRINPGGEDVRDDIAESNWKEIQLFSFVLYSDSSANRFDIRYLCLIVLNYFSVSILFCRECFNLWLTITL